MREKIWSRVFGVFGGENKERGTPNTQNAMPAVIRDMTD
jgi:hypothetical protein